MTQCTCPIAFPETCLLKADEGWHCTRCGWPLPADHERVQYEIIVRTLAGKIGISPDAPVLRLEPNVTAFREVIEWLQDGVRQRAELDRLVRRSRWITFIGLATSLILVGMSLAQVFGLVSRPPPLVFPFILGFIFSITIGLIVAARRQIRALRRWSEPSD